MKKWLLFAILFIAAASVPAEAQSRYEWRQATTEQQLRSLNNPRNTDGIELYSSNGKLVIKTPVKTTDKPFRRRLSSRERLNSTLTLTAFSS